VSDVRAMLACLANEEVARVFASIVLRVTTEDVPRGKAEKAVDALTRSGLITATGESFSLNSEGIRAELAGLRGAPTPDPLQPQDATLRSDCEATNETSDGQRWIRRCRRHRPRHRHGDC